MRGAREPLEPSVPAASSLRLAGALLLLVFSPIGALPGRSMERLKLPLLSAERLSIGLARFCRLPEANGVRAEVSSPPEASAVFDLSIVLLRLPVSVLLSDLSDCF